MTEPASGVITALGTTKLLTMPTSQGRHLSGKKSTPFLRISFLLQRTQLSMDFSSVFFLFQVYGRKAEVYCAV